MNEADVRADVIEPLLLHLGYEAGTPNHIEREVSLRYPYEYCGRKKPGKDRPINKFADYVLRINGHRAWTIEAKPPWEQIDDEVIDQAINYANHPEVNVHIFMICNGRRIAIYQPRQGDYRSPFLEIDYEELHTQLGNLESWLMPEAFQRKFPRVQRAQSKEVAPGFGQEIRITDGEFRMKATNVPNGSLFFDLSPTVREGSITLVNSGLLMRLRVTSGQRQIEEGRKEFGFEWQELWSGDSLLSCDPGVPTLFSSQFIIPLRKGKELYDLSSRKYVEAGESDLEINLLFLLTMDGSALRGIQRCWMRKLDGSGAMTWFEAECWFKCDR